MHKCSIKTLADVDIAVVSGGVIINSNFDSSNLQPVFSTSYKSDLVIPKVSFSTAIENEIIIKPCKILEPEKSNNSTSALQ